MKIILQGKEENSWLDFDDIVFTGPGGKPSMSWDLRNIPPIPNNSIPAEIWCKEKGSTSYFKLANYDPSAVRDQTGSLDLFRILAIKDPKPIIYRPEILLKEHPFLFAIEDATEATTIRVPITSSFVNYMEQSDILDINGEIRQIKKIELLTDFQVELNAPVDLKINDPIINLSKMVDSTDSSLQLQYSYGTSTPFIFKWGTDIEGIRSPIWDTNITISDDSTEAIAIYNLERTASFNLRVFPEPDRVLTDGLTSDSNYIKISDSLTLNKGDYLTIYKDDNNYEIVRVTSVDQNGAFVERGRLGTISLPFSSGTKVYTAIERKFLFVLIPPDDIGSDPIVSLHTRLTVDYL